MSEENNVPAAAAATPADTSTPASTVIPPTDAPATPPEGAAAAQTDTKPPELKVEDKKDDKFSSKFAALTRKEKEILKREQEFKEKYETKLKSYEDAQSKAKEDPIKFLEESGWTYEQLTNFILEGKKPEDMKYKELESKLENLKKEQTDKEIAAQKEMEQRGITKFKADLSGNIKTNLDKYELCSLDEEKAVDLAYELADEYYQKTGKVLELDKTLDIIEQHLEEEAEELWQKKYNKSKKLKGKYNLGQPQAEPPKSEANKDAKSKAASPTLSSQLDSDSPTPTKRLTDDERREAAIQLLKSQM